MNASTKYSLLLGCYCILICLLSVVINLTCGRTLIIVIITCLISIQTQQSILHSLPPPSLHSRTTNACQLIPGENEGDLPSHPPVVELHLLCCHCNHRNDDQDEHSDECTFRPHHCCHGHDQSHPRHVIWQFFLLPVLHLLEWSLRPPAIQRSTGDILLHTISCRTRSTSCHNFLLGRSEGGI